MFSLKPLMAASTAGLAGAAFAMLLASCGGSAPGPAKPADPNAPVNPTVTSLEITASRTSIPARAAETVDLTVTALDASRRAIAKVPVSLSANSGVVSSTATETDDAGKLTGQFSLGQDRSNRTVTVTATAGTIQSTVAIAVTGTTLALSSNPSTVTGPTATARITAQLRDAANQPIGLSTVTFGTNQGTLSATTAVTDATGNASVDLTGVTSSARVTAQVGNTPAEVTVAAAGQGNTGLLPAGILLRDFTVQANPAVIGTNQPGNTGNFSLIEARVTGTVGGVDNVVAQNAPVRFRILTAPAPGTLENNTTTVPALSNVSGIASNRFIAGPTPTGTDAVVVCVSVDGLTPQTPGLANTGCSAQEKGVRLTISAQALFVRLSFNNEINKVDNNLNYEKLFSVVVTDAAGRGVPGVTVTPRLRPVNYHKGNYAPGADSWIKGRTFGTTFTAGPGAESAAAGGFVVCANEDTNFNGVLDPTDNNANNDDKLWPGQAAAVSIDSNGQTDGTGFVILRVKYGQRFATWATYQIEARASVGGSEGSATYDYLLSAAAADVTNLQSAPGFALSPFGFAGQCSNPN